VLYLRGQSSPDVLEEWRAQFVSILGEVDARIERAATETGGHRRVRYVTTSGPGCTVDIQRVTVADTSMSSVTAMTAALRAAGYTSPDRKYLAFADRADTQNCGESSNASDDTPGPGNRNNGTSYTFFYRSVASTICWNPILALHETLHGLGAVMASAPHYIPGGHVSDCFDVLCQSATGTRVCDAHTDGTRIVDCNKDDYFHTNPAPTSYLATHWNTANSRFLHNPSSP
jgi:hypothetical protein